MFEKKLLERFVKYARVWTTSDPKSKETPTTPGQWDLARMLEAELRTLGARDITLTPHCYLIARIPANAPKPAQGFLAHLDTSDEVSGKDVHPVIEESADGGVVVKSGGATLLGADDKAGIAILVTAAEWFLLHPEVEHGELEFIFTPDEETGKGLPDFPLELIHSKTCWTIDGGEEGEVEIECFNAYRALVSFEGRVIHPGNARGILVNAALMASVFAAMLPRSESPEATDGYYGYYCLMEIKGRQDEAHIELILRDFTREGMERRLAALQAIARAVEAQFPGGKVTVKTEPSYFNMKEKIAAHPEVMERLTNAMQTLGMQPVLKPVRGGTDGSRLTELGIPTPNIWTGGRNFHSVDEWVSVREMDSACRLVIELGRL